MEKKQKIASCCRKLAMISGIIYIIISIIVFLVGGKNFYWLRILAAGSMAVFGLVNMEIRALRKDALLPLLAIIEFALAIFTE